MNRVYEATVMIVASVMVHLSIMISTHVSCRRYQINIHSVFGKCSRKVIQRFENQQVEL